MPQHVERAPLKLTPQLKHWAVHLRTTDRDLVQNMRKEGGLVSIPRTNARTPLALSSLPYLVDLTTFTNILDIPVRCNGFQRRRPPPSSTLLAVILQDTAPHIGLGCSPISAVGLSSADA
ncbi:uncharacterized protein BXZ73DRAFT_106266 [Epithele typhae]|uniref:uncharacterized protein n=1 Tax=Epithele typhae TaxID=378194 RepID=UPI002008E908|nr:uncharacterized protein BXZ73DRAFT_106266 [Epithele typhae]KAH9915295.1 hypothetical protein BXZ73DRAFT_106266 [Epithele typhae]